MKRKLQPIGIAGYVCEPFSGTCHEISTQEQVAREYEAERIGLPKPNVFWDQKRCREKCPGLPSHLRASIDLFSLPRSDVSKEFGKPRKLSPEEIQHFIARSFRSSNAFLPRDEKGREIKDEKQRFQVIWDLLVTPIEIITKQHKPRTFYNKVALSEIHRDVKYPMTNNLVFQISHKILPKYPRLINDIFITLSKDQDTEIPDHVVASFLESQVLENAFNRIPETTRDLIFNVIKRNINSLSGTSLRQMLHKEDKWMELLQRQGRDAAIALLLFILNEPRISDQMILRLVPFISKLSFLELLIELSAARGRDTSKFLVPISRLNLLFPLLKKHSLGFDFTQGWIPMLRRFPNWIDFMRWKRDIPIYSQVMFDREVKRQNVPPSQYLPRFLQDGTEIDWALFQELFPSLELTCQDLKHAFDNSYRSLSFGIKDYPMKNLCIDPDTDTATEIANSFQDVKAIPDFYHLVDSKNKISEDWLHQVIDKSSLSHEEKDLLKQKDLTMRETLWNMNQDENESEGESDTD